MNSSWVSILYGMSMESKFVLETLHGPDTPMLALEDKNRYSIGRGDENELSLPKGATVSRNHAIITMQPTSSGKVWMLCDNGSRHGTYLNGIKLKEAQDVRLRSADLISIEPYTFQVVDHAQDNMFTETYDDAKAMGGTSILRVDRTQGGVSLAQERLEALLECSRVIHRAESELEMAEALASAASAGTAFSNVAVIRPVGGSRIEMLAAKGRISLDNASNISRSLLDAAMEGEPVRFQKADMVEEGAQSIMQYSIEEALCIPILIGSSVAGCIYLDNRGGQVSREAADDDIEFCTGLAEIASLAMANLKRIDLERRYTEERHGSLLGTVAALVSALDAKDTYTCGHSERVAWLSRELATLLELDKEIVEQIHICGLVHDIGKIGIPESILQKPGRLTEEEFAQIKAHPVVGEQILQDVPQLHAVLPGVRSHHERWDGKGYPDGTSAEDTPLFGRILGVADAFDAMCSSRAYRDGLNRAKVLDELTACAGTQFDPKLVQLFMQIEFIHYDVMIDFHVSQSSA